MKTIRAWVILLILILSSCSSKDDVNSIIVYGKLISPITNIGIDDARIHIRAEEHGGSGWFSYSTEIDSYTAATNIDGTFTAILNYENRTNVISFGMDGTIGPSTGILDSKKSFYVSDLFDVDSLVFHARKYEELKIFVKSIDPFDENDSIGISIYQSNTNYLNNVFYNIENIGDSNEIWPSPASDNGTRPYWIGENIDSIIYGHIQEGANYVIRWSVSKNGITESFVSDTFSTLSNQLNTFEILY